MNEPFLHRAIELARASVATGGGPFGAVVVRGGEVVAEGANRVVLGCDPTAHAEVEAIRNACRALGTHDLAGCELYASSEPCPMCAAAIHWARVDRLVYAASRDDAAAAGFDDELLFRDLGAPPEERRVPGRRALADEGRAVFDLWRAKADRVPY
ncbi:MAG: nucleoside deaminase [Planctomycetota bacterium]